MPKKTKNSWKRKRHWLRSSFTVALLIFLISWTYIIIRWGFMPDKMPVTNIMKGVIFAIDNGMLYTGGISTLALIVLFVTYLINRKASIMRF